MESSDALPTVEEDEEAAEDVLLTVEEANELSDDELAVSVTIPDCADEAEPPFAEYAVFDAVVPDELPEELVVLVLVVLELAADVSSPAVTLTLSTVPLYGATIWHVFPSSVMSVSSSVSSLRSARSSFSVVVSDTPVR